MSSRLVLKVYAVIHFYVLEDYLYLVPAPGQLISTAPMRFRLKGLQCESFEKVAIRKLSEFTSEEVTA